MDEALSTSKNPFGKPWGLQRDGDLWKIAWNAVAIRGSKSQSLRSVRGHAAEEDIRKGSSKPEDQRYNDKSDELADKVVASIGGEALADAGAGWPIGTRATASL